MSKRRLLDTNLILRYLVQDDPRLAKIADKLFDDCARGELTLIVLPAVLAECVFVLQSYYKQPRAEIARAISIVVTSRGIELIDLAVHLDALERFAKSNLHFVDCTIAASAAAQQLPVATLDRGFKKFSDVVVDID